ncbi:MAG: copper chaperone PCu(A)C, partial [Deltaproteobacteria bacterium]
RNDADHDVALVGATSPVARSVELHTHVDADGMMQMRRVDRFTIPAGGVLRLGSGGPHIMLIGLTQDLVPGATVPLTLRFDDGSELPLELPVQPPGAATSSSAPQADAPH